MSMAGDDQPVVKVTLDRIYEQVLATKDLVAPLPARVSDHDVRIHEHESRLRTIESFIDQMKGQRALIYGIAVVSGGATITTIVSLLR